MTALDVRRRPGVPGSVVVKLRLGEAPASIATAFDVRAGAAAQSTRTGLGAVDRVLAHSAGERGITRVHSSARSVGRIGHGHENYDELEHVLGLSRTFRIDADPLTDVDRVVSELRNLHEVEAAGPNYLCATPFLQPVPAGSLTWARDAVNATPASGYESGDPSVLVAVLDTGIADDSLAGGANQRRGFDAVQLDGAQLGGGMRLLGDSAGIDADPLDEVGHGTACASIIAGAGEDVPPGVAPGCSLLPVRVLGSAQVGHADRRVGVGSVNDIDVGFKRAVDLGAKVLNLSFGTPLDDLGPMDRPPHEDVVAYALAHGCVLVAASGNSGRAERYSPAALAGVIAVGATDEALDPASFSTRGNHVALCAPGTRVVAAGLSGPSVVTGTSFAAPFVAAAAALLVSRAARRAEPLDGPGVERILTASARPWPATGSTAGHGCGILDILGALRLLDADLDRPSRGPPDGSVPPTIPIHSLRRNP
jgi:subtilisin family serine protease